MEFTRPGHTALEARVNVFDTANAYADGRSEERGSRALTGFARRDEVVAATTVRRASLPAPNIGGPARKAIFREGDAGPPMRPARHPRRVGCAGSGDLHAVVSPYRPRAGG